MGCCAEAGEAGAMEQMQARQQLARRGSARGLEEAMMFGDTKNASEAAAMMKLNAKLDEIWDQFDGDEDGVLNLEEGKAFLSSMLQQLTGKEATEENILTTFKEIDADGNGDLDRDEVLEFLKLYI